LLLRYPENEFRQEALFAARNQIKKDLKAALFPVYEDKDIFLREFLHISFDLLPNPDGCRLNFAILVLIKFFNSLLKFSGLINLKF